jgi:hypothetical protein
VPDASSTLLAQLLGLQNADGGFSARSGLPSSSEATALAAFALHDEASDAAATAAHRASAWLDAVQLSDGGWPSAPGVEGGGWTTGLAVLALARVEPGGEAATRGGRWLLGQEGKKTGYRPSLLDRLLGRPPIVSSDDSLVGWPWLTDTYSWVEPTSYAILGLEAVRDVLPADDVTRRIDLGRRMLRDRTCPDDGWNYGNGTVLGQGLWAYPDTTAIALLALRGAEGAVADSARNLDELEHLLSENQSGLATALGVLALSAYGRDVDALRTRLHDHLSRPALVAETRSIGLGLLALNERAHPFGGAAGA